MIVSSENANLKCGICHREITRGATIYQEGFHFGVVCTECYKKNSEEDLELMANMFFAYGGYFGKLKGSNFSIYKALKEILDEFQVTKESISVEEVNIKMMHRALLHGITPREFVEGLKILT